MGRPKSYYEWQQSFRPKSYYEWQQSFRPKRVSSKNPEVNDKNSLGIDDTLFKFYLEKWKRKNLQ